MTSRAGEGRGERRGPMRTPKHQVGDYFSTEARLGEGLKNIRVLRHNDVACNLTGLFSIKLGH